MKEKKSSTKKGKERKREKGRKTVRLGKEDRAREREKGLD